MAAILLLPYSLLRWGSGREILLGLPFIVVTLGLSLAGGLHRGGRLDRRQPGPPVPGDARRRRPLLVDRRGCASWTRSSCSSASSWPGSCTTRSPTTSRRSLSARRPAASARARDPDAAVDALVVIEDEASRTLAELRIHGRRPARGRQPGADPAAGDRRSPDGSPTCPRAGPRSRSAASATSTTSVPRSARPIYRIAQESITNSSGTRGSLTSIDVRVEGDEDCVRLTVHDDGAPVSSGEVVAGLRRGRDDRASGAARRHPGGRTGPERGMDGACRAAEDGDGSMTIRVLVADDQEIVRTGLTMILDAQPGHRGGRPGRRRARGGGAGPTSFARTCACSTSGCPRWTGSRPPVSWPDPASRTPSPSS